MPPAAVAVAFGAVIREMRNKRGMSQETLAELGDFDRTYPSLVERGLRTPTLGAVFRFADAIGISSLDPRGKDSRTALRVVVCELQTPPSGGVRRRLC